MTEILAIAGSILIFLILLLICAYMVYRNGIQKPALIFSIIFVIADGVMTFQNGNFAFSSIINWIFIFVMCYAIIAIGLGFSGKKKEDTLKNAEALVFAMQEDAAAAAEEKRAEATKAAEADETVNADEADKTETASEEKSE